MEDSKQRIPDQISKAWKDVDSNQSKYVSELVKLGSQPSISAQNIGLKECAEMVRESIAKLGFKIKLIPVEGAPDVIYGDLGGNPDSKTLVIYNHYDVQPVEPLDEWKSEPFKPVVRAGKLYGRGVGDDKGELVARVCAIESILNTNGKISSNLKWVIEGEEETGSRHFDNFVKANKSLLKGDGCIWEGGDRSTSGTPEVHLGVKGLLYVEFRLKLGAKDQHSMYGPIAPNPAWRLVNLLKTIKDENERILIDGFYDDVAKPTPQETKYLKRNEFNADELKKALQIDYLLEGRSDVDTVTKLLFSPTANIAGFGSGYLGEGTKTIVPKEAFVKLDFRLVPNMKAKIILRKLKTHLKKKGFEDVEIIVHSYEDPAKTSVGSHVAQTLIKGTEMVYSRSPNVWPTMAGTGPLSVFTEELGLETAMGAGVCYPGSGFHAPNEHIVLDHYFKGIKQLICLFSLF